MGGIARVVHCVAGRFVWWALSIFFCVLFLAQPSISWRAVRLGSGKAESCMCVAPTERATT